MSDPPASRTASIIFGRYLAAAVLDDDAGLRRDVGLQVGVGPLRVAGSDRETGSLELARERAALDQELDFDAGRQDLVEHPDDQLILANR